MSDKRQNNQLLLAFAEEWRGEAPNGLGGGTESITVKRGTESPAISEQLMEEVCERENCRQALARVKANKGSAGMDGMTVQELPEHLKQHWPVIREQLLSGTYKPQPVRRVEIPKPDGGIRKLGIPTVLDRLIQQAVMQVLQRRWDRTFSRHSYGFRPGRSAHQAVEQAQKYIAEGYRWVVDLDLEKFFDRVNHDRLMAKVAERVGDKRLLKLIRAFLTAGVLEGGLVNAVDEGTPQGGPLSPLLSNIVLDEFDRELEQRGLRFARYADDSNIYVRSKRAGERVMESITRFIATKRRIAPKALDRFKGRIRELTSRTRGVSTERMAEELTRYLRGWLGYFGKCETPSVLEGLERWFRRRLRSAIWKQWKRGSVRYAELRKRGVGEDLAAQTAGSPHGPWRLADSPGLHIALPNAYFDSLGIPRLTAR
jgi:RNA-directed DNA polymerase